MATAPVVNLTPTEEKADCLRLLSLVVDGGTLVLRYRFDKAIPPSELLKKLNDHDIRNKLNGLKKKKVLTPAQWSLLYPTTGQPNSARFDVSLLACLLRHICGLDEKSNAWDYIPPSTDTSVEADIKRLWRFRNEVSHMKSLTLHKQEFQRKWNKYEQILLRLGSGMINLCQQIQDLKDKSLDPAKEQIYLERIREWEEMDESLKTDMIEIKTQVQNVAKDVEIIKDSTAETLDRLADIGRETMCNNTRIEHLEKQHQSGDEQNESLRKDVLLHDCRLTRIESQQKTLEQIVQKNKETFEEETTIIYERLAVDCAGEDTLATSECSVHSEENKLSVDRSTMQSSRVHHMSSVVTLYSRDPELEVYVRTHAHEKAEEKLNTSGCVILSGLPGEGKTMMASKLLSERTTGERCLKVNNPSDWDDLVLNKGTPLTIFIDDIFGAGALDDKVLDKWSQRLPDIEKAIKEKVIKVIITTRHYILHEAKQKLRKLTLFKDDNIQILASFELTCSERAEILGAHLTVSKREFSSGLIANCCKAYENASSQYLIPEEIKDYLPEVGSQKVRAMIGFPEIVNLFVANDHLFTKGEYFFQQPLLFFKKCMEELFLDEERFLALILLWTKPDKSLEQQEVEPPNISEELKSTAMKFGISLEGKTSTILRKSLKYHSGGFLNFSTYSGTYTFSHNTVKDMVGLVAGQEYKGAVLEFADKEFILQFVTTDESKDDGLHIFIEQYIYWQLQKAICRILEHKDLAIDELKIRDRKIEKRFGNAKWMSTENEITINTSVLKHDCFKKRAFVEMFCKSEEVKYLFSKPVELLPETCIDWNCDIQFGKQLPVYLPSLGLLYKTKLLLLEYFKHHFDKCTNSAQFLETNLIIASREGLKDIIEKLLEKGTTVSENSIYFAAAKGHEECLEYLLRNYNGDCTFCSNSKNKNSPLIAAAKIGAVQCMQCLIRHGADVQYRNKNGWSALDKAILYSQPESCKTLLENKAALDNKTGQFKRTPLHMNADVGRESITNILLQYGASLKVKDHRGHYPIHCAAFRGKNKIVDTLLKADIARTTLKHRVSYGEKSVIKGADLFHIAVYKKNAELIEILLQNNINPNVRDFYGRTPIYRAVYESEKKSDTVVKHSIFDNLLEQLRDIMRQNNQDIEFEQAKKDPSIEIINMLLNRADVKLAERNGYTPLHAAVHRGQTDIVKLLAPVSNINARDKYGKSPLHTACEQVDLGIFKFLVEDCKADFRILTKAGLSVFDILDKKTEWRYIRRRYKSGKHVTKFMLETPPYKSFREIIFAKDPDFANIHTEDEEDPQAEQFEN